MCAIKLANEANREGEEERRDPAGNSNSAWHNLAPLLKSAYQVCVCICGCVFKFFFHWGPCMKLIKCAISTYKSKLSGARTAQYW